MHNQFFRAVQFLAMAYFRVRQNGQRGLAILTYTMFLCVQIYLSLYYYYEIVIFY